jgi:nicrotizing toxin Mtb-like protein
VSDEQDPPGPQVAPVDRIGTVNGTLLHVMVDGVPASFESRSLPPSALATPHVEYLLHALPAGWSLEVGEVAPWFGQPGGATQLFVLDGSGRKVRVADLVRLGVLA